MSCIIVKRLRLEKEFFFCLTTDIHTAAKTAMVYGILFAVVVVATRPETCSRRRRRRGGIHSSEQLRLPHRYGDIRRRRRVPPFFFSIFLRRFRFRFIHLYPFLRFGRGFFFSFYVFPLRVVVCLHLEVNDSRSSAWLMARACHLSDESLERRLLISFVFFFIFEIRV